MVIVLFDLFQTLLPAHRRIHTHLIHRQNTARHLDIGDVVVHHQDLCQRRNKALALVLTLRRQFQVIVIAHRRGVRNLLIIGKGKYAADTVGTLNRDLSAHAFHKAFADRQSQTGTLNGTVGDHIGPLEAVKQCRKAFLTDTPAGVFHGNLHQSLSVLLLPVHIQADVTAVGVLGCIGQDVGVDLPHLRFIPEERSGDILIYMHDQLHVLIRQTHTHHIADVLQHQAQVVLRLCRLHLAGLDL